MLKFIKNQALADQSIKEMNTDELDPFTLTLYLYTDQACQSRNFINQLEHRSASNTSVLTRIYAQLLRYLLQAEGDGKPSTELKTALATPKRILHTVSPVP